MSIVDFATLGLIGCLIAFVAMLDDFRQSVTVVEE